MGKTEGPKVAKQILALLRDRHRGSEWAWFEELRTGTGFHSDAQQRVDAFAMHLWPSAGYARTAYEVKASRGDFLREKKDLLKPRAAILMSNYFVYAAPMGIIKPEELPREAGLVEVSAEGKLYDTVPAPYRDVAAPNVMLMAAMARRVHELEDKLIEERTFRYLAGREVYGRGVRLGTLIDEVFKAHLENGFYARYDIERLFADERGPAMVDALAHDVLSRLAVELGPTTKNVRWASPLRLVERKFPDVNREGS